MALTKNDIKPGLKLEAFYGDGTRIGVREVVRTSDKSVWLKHSENFTPRYSYNTILTYIQDGIFKIIES